MTLTSIFTGGFAHVYLVTTDKSIAMPVSATSTPGSTSSATRGETHHVLKRMAVPDKEALASVRSEVEVHVSGILALAVIDYSLTHSPLQKALRSHPNIVHFIEASATALPSGGYEIFILMEYCSGGGIIDLMNSRLRNRLTEGEVLKIFGDVAAGLSVMHHCDPPLLHRDLKVENILLAPPPRSNPSAGPTYKLCDFGSSIPILSRRAPKSLEEVKKLEADLNKHTTLQYRAPEMVDVYQRRVIDEKADVWAMGVLLYKLCYYTTPFEENGGGPLAILNARYRFPQMPAYSQRLKDLIASMLQEQSTSRPTIDQVILGIHRILGTTPPASAVHYSNLASSGNQVQPLPSVSSASSSCFQNSGTEVAAHALAKHQAVSNTGPAGGVSKDLIEMAPSESEQRRVEQEEFKKRSEGITPMRRGRPNRASNNTAAASASTTVTPISSSRPSSPIKISATSPVVPLQPSGQQTLGFTDSFSPPKHSPSRPESALHYSLNMPGMVSSNRASPLPPGVLSPPIAPVKSPLQNDEAGSRFPSVEELDLQYGSGYSSKPSNIPSRSRTITIPSSMTSTSMSSSSSRSNLIPGLSERAPVSAMAGKFGSMASNTSNGSTSSLTSPPPSVTNRWTGGGLTGATSVAKRWPHQESGGSSSSRISPTLPRDSASPAPTLPARKPYLHDWLTDKSITAKTGSSSPAIPAPVDSPSSSIEKNSAQEEADSSSDDDEDEKPEDADETVGHTNHWHGVIGKGVFEERREAAQDRNSTWNKPSTITPSYSTGKVKTPDWVQQNKESDSVASNNPAPSVPFLSTTETKTAAKPPAWDEDDEEMHFIPQPHLDLKSDQGFEHQARNQFTDATRIKKYADASTSPGHNTPTMTSPLLDRHQPYHYRSAAPPPIVKERKPSVLAPKPIRSQSIKDVGGLVSKYQDVNITNDGSNESASQKQAAIPSSATTNSSLVQQRKDSLVNGSRPANATSLMAPPRVTASKPTSWSSSQKESSSSQATITPKNSLKPWEKEALEKEQVHKYGSLRSASPSKIEVESRPEQAAPTAVRPEAQDRFSGVSSLISQWQSNSSKGAPGWGTVGGIKEVTQSINIPGRIKSREEEDLIKRSSTIHGPLGRRHMQGRLPSREV